MESLVKTPSKSVMIIYNVFHDSRLAKNPTKRLRTAFIYGLLRRTFNNSLNHLNQFYSKRYGTVYCINQITTMIERSGFKRNTIVNSFNSLKKYGYIDTKYNPHRHVKFIFMPKVMAHELTNQNIFNGVSLKNKRSGFKKPTNVSLKNQRRCSEHKSNEHKLMSTHKDTQKQKPIQWIKNYGLGKSVNDYLIKHSANLTEAFHKAKKITALKNNVNRDKGVKYQSVYFHNENNDYVQNGGLLEALKNGKDIAKDYGNYLDNHKIIASKPRNNNKVKHSAHIPPELRGDTSSHPKLDPTSKARQKRDKEMLRNLNKPKDQRTNDKKPSNDENTNGSDTLEDGSSINPFATDDKNHLPFDRNDDSDIDTSSKKKKQPTLKQQKKAIAKRDDFAFFTKWGSWYSTDGAIHEPGKSMIKRMNDPKQLTYIKQYQNKLKVTA